MASIFEEQEKYVQDLALTVFGQLISQNGERRRANVLAGKKAKELKAKDHFIFKDVIAAYAVHRVLIMDPEMRRVEPSSSTIYRLWPNNAQVTSDLQATLNKSSSDRQGSLQRYFDSCRRAGKMAYLLIDWERIKKLAALD